MTDAKEVTPTIQKLREFVKDGKDGTFGTMLLAEIDTLTRELDEARKERDAAVAWQTEGYLQLMALYKSTRTAAPTQGDA